jgi:hypothetical protein
MRAGPEGLLPSLALLPFAGFAGLPLPVRTDPVARPPLPLPMTLSTRRLKRAIPSMPPNVAVGGAGGTAAPCAASSSNAL